MVVYDVTINVTINNVTMNDVTMDEVTTDEVTMDDVTMVTTCYNEDKVIKRYRP